MRVIIEISNFAIDIAPGYVPPLAPAPPWLHSVTSRSSHAEKNGSQAGSLYGCRKTFGVGKLIPFSPTERAHSSSSIAASMSHIGRCIRPMWRSGSIEHTSASHWLYMRWPARSRSKSCSTFGAPHEQRVGLERDRLAVLAVVEHHLGRDAVARRGRAAGRACRSGPPSGGCRERTPQSAPIFWPPKETRSFAAAAASRRCCELTGVGVEVVEQLRRAVRPQVLAEAGTDVRVARDHDDGRRLLAVGVRGVGLGDGHGSPCGTGDGGRGGVTGRCAPPSTR